MMKGELKKKFEELRNAVLEFDTENKVLGVNFDKETGMLEVHAYNCDFPAHNPYHEQYVWNGGKHYEWQKQVIINGVRYYDFISQEQFDKEHQKDGGAEND